MPEAHVPAAVPPEQALHEVVAGGATAALLGDRDPVEMVAAAAAAAGRPFEHVDARGLRTAEFDVAVRGVFRDGAWEEGALTRMLRAGGVFLLAHGEALLDDLRQRSQRMLLSRRVTLTGPRPEDDRSVEAVPESALILHVDDHRPLLLQSLVAVQRFPRVIRADVDGPPPLARRRHAP